MLRRTGSFSRAALTVIVGLSSFGAACGGMSRDPNLFNSSAPQASSSSSAGAFAAGGEPNLFVAGSTGYGAGAASGSLASSGGSNPASAGSPSSGTGGGIESPAGPAGAAGQAGAGASAECAQYGAEATYFAMTEHCYLAVHTTNTYAAAQTACAALGAHLVTITSEAEDHFVWNLSPNEHWLGASDGKGPNEQRPGTYTWVNGEPFDYHAWSSSQPDASETDCGMTSAGKKCYEHCAFHWTGGDRPGQWNDRFCLHTIESICEWDSAKPR